MVGGLPTRELSRLNVSLRRYVNIFNDFQKAADAFRRELGNLAIDELSPKDKQNFVVLVEELNYFREGHNWRM